MTKRILSMVIVLAMLLSVLPVHMVVSAEPVATALAHNDATHTCSAQCPGGTITWTPWGVTNGSADTLPTASGHYFLECDLSLTARNDIPAGADVTICLNGCNITETGSGNVSYVLGNLTISDCTATYDAAGNYVSGAISGCNFSDGGVVNVRRGGKFVLESGKLTGNTVNGGGGAVSIQAKSSTQDSGAFYMYGGQITGNTAASGGGVVANNGGKIFVYGGRIDGNTAKNSGPDIYIGGADSRITVSGSPYIGRIYFDNDSNGGIQVSGLTTGAKIGATTKTTSLAVDKVIKVTGTQDSWDCHWVTVNGKSISRDGSTFKFGHFHGTQEYTARTGTGLPTGATAGKMNYYYLAEDINRVATQAQVDLTNQVTICLNGYEIIHNNPANGIYNITTGALVLEDGWAHTDANGIYQAGGVTYGAANASTVASGAVFAINGGSFTLNAGRIYGFRGASAPIYAVGGKITVNGGQILNNTCTNTGAGIYAKDDTVFTMTDGLVANNRSDKQAGGIYLLRSTVAISGGTFQGNYAKQDAASLYIHSSNGTLANAKFIDNESATSGSGVGFSSASGKTCEVAVSNITVTGNKGGNGALLVNSAGSTKITVSDSVIQNNDVFRGGIYLLGNADVTLHNVKVTDNTASIAVGGVYWEGANSKLTVSGNTVIKDNTCKGAVSNLCLMDPAQMLAVKDLDAAASIGISNRTGYVSSEMAADYSASFFCDDGENVVTLDSNKLYIGSGHRHCVDGKTDCGHTQENWNKWTGTDSLPTSGCYYLANDVVLKDEVRVSTELKLCLNGHTVTAATDKRIISTTKDQAAVVTIADCAGNGKLTGGVDKANNTGGGAIFIRAKGTLNLYAGIITGNQSITAAGAILIADSAVFNMYGGEISDNGGKDAVISGGAIFGMGNSEINIYGGKIANNTGRNGGAIYSDGKLTIAGGEISGNTATEQGGAIYAKTGPLTITGGVIENNASTKDGGGLYFREGSATISGCVVKNNSSQASGGGLGFTGNAQVTMTGCTITGNSSPNGGAIINQGGATLTIQGGSIEGNTSSGPAGGVFVNTNAKLILEDGCQIKDNISATKGGGVYVTSGAFLELGSSTISGNQAGQGSGVYVSEGADLTLQDAPVILGNSGSNLIMEGAELFTVKTLTSGAAIALDAQPGVISEPCDDYAAFFTSDSSYRKVDYVDGALHMVAADGYYHKHCLCNGKTQGCNHTGIEWTVWEKTDSLPTSGYYYLIADVQLKSEVVVSSDLHLCLNGYTVTAVDGKRILSTTKNAEALIEITDCTGNGKLTGGRDLANNTGGGAIFIRAKGTLNLYSGIITDNKTITAGGAILLADDAVLNMYGGQISENGAVEDGKFIDGGAVYGMLNSEINIYGGKITNNVGKYGGGIYASGALTITGGEISSNTTSGQGGGVYAKTGDLLVSGGLIENNHAAKDGGGFYYGVGNATITGGTFRGNSSDASSGGIAFSKQAQVVMTGGLFTGNTAPNGGGVNVMGSAHLQLKDAQIEGNAATGTGGGIYVNTDSYLTMTGGTVANNTSTGSAAGINVTGGIVTISGGNILNNVSQKDGGGLYVRNAGNVNISGDVLFSGNQSVKGAGGGICYTGRSTGIISGGLVEKNKAPNGGGMIFQGGANGEITDITVKNNRATTSGGGIYVNNSTLKMSGGKVTGNSAEKSQGGGMFAYGSEVTLSGGSFSGNSSQKDGGGVYNSKGTMRFSGVTITGNESIKGAGGGAGATKEGRIIMTGGSVSYNKAGNAAGIVIQSKAHLDMYGGTIGYNQGNQGVGMYVNNASANLQAGTIIGNVGTKNGGGAFTYNSKMILGKGLTVTKNESTNQYGGGFYFGQDSVVDIDGTKFVGNTSKGGGTGFYTFKAEAKIKDVYVAENTTTASTSGGVCLSRETKFEWEGGVIENNYSSSGGSGILIQNWAEGTITGLTIRNNTAGVGGGGLFCYTCVDANFIDCEIYGNKTTTSGAGVFLSSPRGSFDPLSYINFTGCKIYDNTADDTGAGIYLSHQIVSTWTDCEIYNNTAGNYGGGIYAKNGSITTLNNVRMTGNEAGKNASALWIGDDFTMKDVTITGNEAKEGFAVVYPKNDFDGESYQLGHYTMSGDIIITENQGVNGKNSDVFIDEGTAIGSTGEGFGKNTKFTVQLASGILTNTILAEYDYEGGDLIYTVTYGDRSTREPEYEAPLATEESQEEDASQQTQQQTQQKAKSSDIVLYVAIGAVVLVILAVAVLIVVKKKKSGKTPETSK